MRVVIQCFEMGLQIAEVFFYTVFFPVERREKLFFRLDIFACCLLVEMGLLCLPYFLIFRRFKFLGWKGAYTTKIKETAILSAPALPKLTSRGFDNEL